MHYKIKKTPLKKKRNKKDDLKKNWGKGKKNQKKNEEDLKENEDDLKKINKK
jgi:hypothetical protein